MPLVKKTSGSAPKGSQNASNETSINQNKKLDPQKLFDLVSQNYESWLKVINKEFQDENYLPFPQEESSTSSHPDRSLKPIFDYSIVDALEEATNEFSDKYNQLKTKGEQEPSDLAKHLGINSNDLLHNSEIEYLRNKISSLVLKHKFGFAPEESNSGGFSLYDTKDEEGLHAGNAEIFDDDQDDYDVEEIEDGEFSYDYSPTHHIEVELNTGPVPCDVHGDELCDCTDRDTRYFDEDGPSCEFTFEYDKNGKLVPADNNIEEQLRLMNLQGRTKSQIKEITQESSGKKKKKKKKSGAPKPPGQGQCCLFCQYEAFYGTKPVQMMKWYDQRIKREEERRQEVRRKLDNAKLRALRRQEHKENHAPKEEKPEVQQ